MLITSKAKHIESALNAWHQKTISNAEYSQRMDGILSTPYTVSLDGIEHTQEINKISALVANGTISSKIGDVQTQEILQLVNPSPGQPNMPPPRPVEIMRKKGYVAPIVWLIIGVVLLCIPFIFVIGIIVIIFALISLSMRVSYNKRAEAQNTAAIVNSGARPPYV